MDRTRDCVSEVPNYGLFGGKSILEHNEIRLHNNTVKIFILFCYNILHFMVQCQQGTLKLDSQQSNSTLGYIVHV